MRMTSNNVERYKEHFEILELKTGAPFIEVKTAYFHLRKLYATEPLVMSPIMDEISEAGRQDILNRLDNAYQTLKEYYADNEQTKLKTAKDRVERHNVPEFEVFSGNALRLTREVLGIELKELALFTGIPLRHLKNLEMERFDHLPPKGYIRVFLKKYAEYLSLDSQKVIDDYLKGFEKKTHR